MGTRGFEVADPYLALLEPRAGQGQVPEMGRTGLEGIGSEAAGANACLRYWRSRLERRPRPAKTVDGYATQLSREAEPMLRKAVETTRRRVQALAQASMVEQPPSAR